MAEDPWKHRSKGMVCGTCMFFVAKALPPPPAVGMPMPPVKGDLDVEVGAPDPRLPLGRCRRHAPTMGGYPAVFAKDWCGDHKLDETKL